MENSTNCACSLQKPFGYSSCLQKTLNYFCGLGGWDHCSSLSNTCFQIIYYCLLSEMRCWWGPVLFKGDNCYLPNFYKSMYSKELLPGKQKQDLNSFLLPIFWLKLISVQKKDQQQQQKNNKFKAFGISFFSVLETQVQGHLVLDQVAETSI